VRVGICHQVSLPGTWEDAIASAAALGVDGVELFVRPEDVPAFLESRDHARRLAEQASQARVVAALQEGRDVFGADEQLDSVDPEGRGVLDRVLPRSGQGDLMADADAHGRTS